MASDGDKSGLLRELRIDRAQREGPAGGRRGVRIALIVLALCLAVGAAGTYLVLRGQRIEFESASAVVPTADRCPASGVQATGYVTSRRGGTGSAQITGTLAAVMIREGEQVKAGQVLARLDDTAQKAALAQTRAQLKAAAALRVQFEAQLQQARRDLKRNADLIGRNLVSQQAVETAQTQVDSLAAQVDAQEKQQELAQAEIDGAEVQLGYTVVRAPFSGVIIAKAAQAGEIISPISAGGGVSRTGVGRGRPPRGCAGACLGGRRARRAQCSICHRWRPSVCAGDQRWGGIRRFEPGWRPCQRHRDRAPSAAESARWGWHRDQQTVRLEMSALVEIRKLSKVYERGKQRIEVLHHVDLDIQARDFLALMGPSGSGKTTLLNLIGGLDSPTEGSIVVGEQRIDRLSESALARWRAAHVGFVFQFYNLLPMLTARKNVELPLLLTRLSAPQRRRNAEIALELVGLGDRCAHKPGELSGGQQQRVAIARAIVSDPTLLVCDEPTGDLDRQSAAEVLSLLQQLNREHDKTIIMVTHDPKAAEYANYTLRLDKGSLVEHGESLPA